MRAVRIVNGSIEVVDVPLPGAMGEGPIRRAGICGSTLHMLEHGYIRR